MKYILFFYLFFLITSCDKEPSSQSIIKKTIEAHGGAKIANSIVSFDFRDKRYTANYLNGSYSLSRSFTDTANNNIIDILTNTNFKRKINNVSINITDKLEKKYASSINSVLYFFRLPFHLKDPAVLSEYLGIGSINGEVYHKIKVTFLEKDGGEDYTDHFVYWFNSTTYTLDYMAYEYATNGGGKRFRKAVNQRRVNGWLINDYINYKPKDIEVDIDQYDIYFSKNGLEKLSEITHKNIEVRYNK